MTKVLLINQEKVPHYRVSAYNYLAAYLTKQGFDLTIMSEGIQPGNIHKVEFTSKETSLTFFSISRAIIDLDPEVIIYWVRLRHLYLFPMILFIKMVGKKTIYWGHGVDLYSGETMWLKKFANDIEYRISDALILYGEHLKKYVKRRHHHKTFIANNTLYFNEYRPGQHDKASTLKKYGIGTRKNIIYVGRMQRRKKLEDLFGAFQLMNRPDVGLILVGPDDEGVLGEIQGDNVYKLGSIYGDDRLDLMAASDVFCMPGPVGLSIVDSFYCGVPIVTEAGDESPESMYLKNGINGFIVPKGDVGQLASRLRLLLEDEALRERFSQAARTEITTNGHIDRMCEGFSSSLRFVCDSKS